MCLWPRGNALYCIIRLSQSVVICVTDSPNWPGAAFSTGSLSPRRPTSKRSAPGDGNISRPGPGAIRVAHTFEMSGVRVDATWEIEHSQVEKGETCN